MRLGPCWIQPKLYTDHGTSQTKIETRPTWCNCIFQVNIIYTELTTRCGNPCTEQVKRWAQAHGLEFQDIDGQGGACWSFGKATV